MKKNNKGYVLVSVLVIMSIMLIITFFLADILFSEVAISNNQKAATISFNLAEAGVSEAVWRIKNDPATRNTFQTTQDGTSTFSHDPALLSGGSYEVTIQNTATAAATITSIGYYNFGSKKAQRKISINAYQTNLDEPYNHDASLLIGGPSSGDINLTNVNISQDAGSEPSGMFSGGNINVTNSTITLSKDLLANKEMTLKNANITVSGNILANQDINQQNSNLVAQLIQDNYSPPIPDFNLPNMPAVTQSCLTNPSSLKCISQNQGHYYATSQTYKNKNNLTFDGITYIAGSATFTNVNNLTINGLLVTEGSISFTNVSNFTINHTDNSPSGVIGLSNFSLTNATGTINGLVYVGNLFSASVNTNLTINGAYLAHQFTATNATLKFNFNKDWVNEALTSGGASAPPVIEFQHWEEEY